MPRCVNIFSEALSVLARIELARLAMSDTPQQIFAIDRADLRAARQSSAPTVEALTSIRCAISLFDAPPDA